MKYTLQKLILNFGKEIKLLNLKKKLQQLH